MGGTFNPIHYGHLVTAEEARAQFQLEKVIFMPSARPPHKTPQPLLSAEDRYLMTTIATASNPDFVVSRLEIDRPGYSYTIDTVTALAEMYPGAALYFITGADAVWEILTWKNPEKIARYCTFIAATRPGYPLAKFQQLRAENDHLPEVEIMKIPALAISSTDIRRRIKAGRPIRYLVPEGVVNYIYKSGFYR